MLINEQLVEKGLDSLESGSSILLLVESTDYTDIREALLKTLSARNNLVIYITLNKSYDNLKKLTRKLNIREGSIFYIDMISKKEHEDAEKGQDVLFLQSPRCLTDLSIAITEINESVKAENRVIILDSLSTMAIYNTQDTATKFAHFIATEARKWESTVIMFALKHQINTEVKEILSQFCDKIIEI